MNAGEREFRCAMVERRGLPRRCRMTGRTRLAEVAGDVIRVGRASEVRAVTLIAINVRDLIIIVDVARLTLDRLVVSCQREFRRAMVE